MLSIVGELYGVDSKGIRNEACGHRDWMGLGILHPCSQSDGVCAGNEVDLYREWGRAVAWGRVEAALTRRYAAGSVQVRPPRDGKVAGYVGLERIWQRHGTHVFAHDLPRPGRRTAAIEKGYLANAWFRLRHPDYDALRGMLDDIGRSLRVRVVPG